MSDSYTLLKNVDHLQCDENLVEDDEEDDENPPHLQPNTSNVVIVEEEEEDEEYLEGEEDETEFLTRLIASVKEIPILYDPIAQRQMSKNHLNRARDDAWHRLQNQHQFMNISQPLETIWNSLVDQFTTSAKESMDLRLRAALSWLDRFIGYSEPQAPPELLDDSTSVQEDVMISGCRTIPMVSQQNQGASGGGYVVVQQQQQGRGGHVAGQNPRVYQHQQHQQVSNGNARRLVVSSTHPPQNHQQYKRSHPQLQAVKKEDSNVTTMMVDMTTYYDNGNGQKLYRLMTVPQNGGGAQQRQQYHIPRSQNIEYDMPPEPIIESSNSSDHQVPPRKKMAPMPQMITTTSTTSTSTIQSNNRVEDNRIVAGGVPIADDEIIDDGIQESTIVIDPDGHLHEESPLLNASPDVMISGQSTSNRHLTPLLNNEPKMGGLREAQIPGTSGTQQMHHQHISRTGRPEELEDPVETATAEILEQQNQYDADLQFQQLISSHLSRLSDDDKAIMKYHMQRILLDARFGEGTAKHMIPEVEILEHDGVEEGEVVVHGETSNSSQQQQKQRFNQ